jgi:sRNA-binding carbon storage regulator CsrA
MKNGAEYGFYKKGYLILKRKVGQGVNIDLNTEIIIARQDATHVYLAIKAPGKKVLRNEIVSNEPRKPDEPTGVSQ